ncbi:MAG: hypothetical protein WBX25_29015 [Rhodomicrobium sp.]
MAALTDKTLMAYADDVLDGETRRSVEVVLRTDAASRRRVEMFRQTGARLADLYRKPMLEPVPSHLIDFVMGYGKEDERSSIRRPNVWNLSAWRERFAFAPMHWQAAAAAVAVFFAGAGAGWVLHSGGAGDGGQRLTALERGQIFAEGPLQQVLNAVPSGQDVRISGSAQDSTVVRATLTFKNKEGGYCREYELANANEERFSGLACRTNGGKWAIRVHVQEGGKTVLAGGARQHALDTVVDGLINGDALGKKQEEAVIAKDWK